MPRRQKGSTDKPKIKYVRTTISLPEDTLKKAQQNAAKRGFQASLSSYLAWLCENSPEK